MMYRPYSCPFRHTVWDDILSEPELDDVISEWPDKNDPSWYTSSCGKLSMPAGFPDSASITMEYLKSKDVIESLEGQFGVSDLICDDSNFGGGLHWMPPGTKLDMHVDFNQNEEGLYRRVNLLLFLSEGWKEADKGELVLGLIPHISSIAPIFNRVVAFPYSEIAWHGVPEPVVKERKSIACYYYTKEKPPGFTENHSTIYEESKT